MAMGNNYHVAATLPLLLPGTVVLADLSFHFRANSERGTIRSDLANDGIYAATHILGALTAWASVAVGESEGNRRLHEQGQSPILPDDPGRVALLDLGREETFVFAIVPLPHFFANDMVWELREMIKQEMERLVSADTGRDKHRADVTRINDPWRGVGPRICMVWY